jgi:hypothetical protein
LIFELRSTASCSSKTRGLIAGGSYYVDPTHFTVNVIQYITIATTGNAADFGDLTGNRMSMTGSSNVHGGLP